MNFFNSLINSSEELHQSQVLIKELQKKLQQELNKQNKNKNTSVINGESNTLDNIETNFNCCSKCSEELEIKIRQIENLKK